MNKTNIIALVVFVAALVWVFTLDNAAVLRIQSKVLGVVGLAKEGAADVAFDDDTVNGEVIGAGEIAGRYEKDVLAERYRQLLIELFELRAYKGRIDIMEEEIRELKQVNNYVEDTEAQGLRLVAARVIERQSGSWWRSVVIDKGAKDGLVEGCSVITPVAVDSTERPEGALVGKVTNVGPGQATVVLITDPDCKVAGYVYKAREKTPSGPQRVRGILSGAPNASTSVPYLLLRNLPKEADQFGVQEGAKIFSTGVGAGGREGVFPAGLLLGFIKEFEPKEIDGEARVSPAIDFNALSYVFVRLPYAGDTGGAPRAEPLAPEGDGPPVPPRAEPVEPSPPRAEPVEGAPPEVPRARPVGDELGGEG